ncbi:serine/threonine-protein kinase [Wenzhouxiangella limi]|uniref:Serine/threonine protein kinase n=1 Tax=Wenzhouxiangella limi TaxID=2707351 RepID=A0A845UW66_9GAMM|nr:serine/threonine-protein kinase [Wenzhouxiangella limi]NDY96083.1 serine/threonine protein kinase [Wenzhouxiangella limi]
MSDPDPQRYLKAKAIAEQLLAVEPVQRAATMTALCGQDPALRQDVEWLLAAAEDDSEDDAPERFQTAARSALMAVALEVPMPRNYRLLERLDAGGTGVVYLAERIDGEVTQRVALKLLLPAEELTQALADRFANERQALARLSHPNIAHLIDGGLTADGRPFLATEYVRGEPIDAWCEKRNAALDQRLELVIKVCEAVDYAHRHMVIHRDLKPSNVLVTAEGEPKLLDFGIARMMDDRPQDGTDPEGRFMTLAYASPEQLAGQSMSAASDVYSLGVILRELLTGRRPFDALVDPHERLETLKTRPLSSLRKRAAAGQSAPVAKISKDLDAIVKKALAPKPEERYRSARELARDLERLGQKRTVAARGGGKMYRLERFLARHRLSVALSLLALALLIGFMADREKQLQRISWERDRAEAVTGFMNDVFSGADSLPSRGNTVTVREILDRASERLATSEAFSPAALGSIHLALGQAYNALGLGQQALPLLSQAREDLASSSSLTEQAHIEAEIAAAFDSAGRAAAAIAADRRALALYSQTAEAGSDRVLRVRIRKLRNHANVMDVPLDQTVAELESIVADLAARPSGTPELLFEARSALVAAYVIQNQPERALQTAREAEPLARQLYDADDPRRLRGQHAHATALMLSDPALAIERFGQLVADHERLVGPSQRLANTLGNLGVALASAERDAEAIAAFQRAAAMIENVAGRDHYLYRLSVSNRAALHLRVGEPDVAERLIRALLTGSADLDEPLGGIELSYRAQALDILGSALVQQDRLAEAAQAYRQALALLPAGPDQATGDLRNTLSERLDLVERQLGQAVP